MDRILPVIQKTRNSGRKVRSGCATCKQRHIKCDEAKPTCHRCAHANRDCEYPTLTRITRVRTLKPAQEGKKKFEKQALQLQQQLDKTRPRALLPRPISTTFPGSEKDFNLFQLFRDRMAHELGGTHGMRVYNVTVLRECYENATIRHLVFAISGLSQAHTTSSKLGTNEDYYYALVHQSIALAKLRTIIGQGISQLRIAVITCALLFVYESCQGHYQTARQQVISGSKLLQIWHLARNKEPARVPAVDEELICVFPPLELGLSGFSLLNPYHEPTIPSIVPEIKAFVPPDHALSFGAARIASLRWTQALMCLWHDINRWKQSSTPPFTVPAHLQDQFDYVIMRMSSWYPALKPLVNGGPPGSDSFSAALVQASILFKTGLSMYECVHDEFLPEYQQIVSKAALALQADGRKMQGAYTKVTVLMEIGQQLFFAGTRCRDRAVRAEVIRLLRENPRKQGLFDFAVMAKVIEWVMSIETVGSNSEAYIPEENRIRMHTLMWDSQDDGIHVKGVRGYVEGSSAEHEALLRTI